MNTGRTATSTRSAPPICIQYKTHGDLLECIPRVMPALLFDPHITFGLKHQE